MLLFAAESYSNNWWYEFLTSLILPTLILYRFFASFCNHCKKIHENQIYRYICALCDIYRNEKICLIHAQIMVFRTPRSHQKKLKLSRSLEHPDKIHCNLSILFYLYFIFIIYSLFPRIKTELNHFRTLEVFEKATKTCLKGVPVVAFQSAFSSWKIC